MTFETWAAFALATAVLILIPGPSIMLTVAHASLHGAWRTLNTVNGAIAACLVHVAIAATGIGWLMILAAEWFEVLRWFGVAYLVFMGVQSWRAASRAEAEAAPRSRSGRSLFTEGFLVTLSNPKGIIFVAAFFPQFLTPAARRETRQSFDEVRGKYLRMARQRRQQSGGDDAGQGFGITVDSEPEPVVAEPATAARHVRLTDRPKQ